MSKCVLVMDMPSSCSKCDLRGQNYGLENVCLGKVEHSKKYGDYYKDIQNIEKRPDWCPLRELPEKKDSMNLNSIMEKCKDRDSIMDSVLKQFIVDGYNACIDELLKGEKG